MAVHPNRVPCRQTERLSACCTASVVLLLILLPFASCVESYGYDSAPSCDPTRASRRGRSQLLKAIPCDLSVQAYCNLPGSAYPWHAVRRFVHENQGLMRRMYGDVRHISVLKEEFENNEIEIDDIDRATERYSRPAHGGPDRERRVDGGKRMKYLRTSAPQQYDSLGHYLRDKSNEIAFTEPHFRPAQLKPASTSPTPTTEASTTEVSRPASVPASELPKTTTTTLTPTRPTAETLTTATMTPTPDSQTPLPRTDSVPTTTTTSKSTAAATTVESPPRPSQTNTSTDRSTLLTETGTEVLSSKDGSGHKSSPEGVPIAIQETPKNTNNDSSHASIENAKTQPIDQNDSIDMEALAFLAKLETNEALFTSAEPAEVNGGDDALGGKISSTLKLSSSSSSATAAAEEQQQQHPDSPYATDSNGAKVDEIETTISSYPHDRQDTDDDSTEVTTDPEANGKEAVAEALVHADSLPSGSTVHQQKIRFESIKGGGAGVGVGVSAVKKQQPNAEGQLFQDAAQKEPPIVNGRGVNACPVKEEVVAPFWANNTRGEVLALLNLYPFEQYVHWEKCTHELKQMYCREGCRCEQQYRLHRLLAYDPHNECRGIFSDWFRFPSCCICKCYDMPFDFRVTSRSPRSLTKQTIELVEDELQNAIYEHATDEWYRPKEQDFD